MAGGWAFTAVAVALALRRLRAEDVPRLSLFTSIFFVASLIHFPVGPTSVHLILNGLVGMTTGSLSYLAILIGLALQAAFFGHGGLTTIGVNAVDMGVPALIAWLTSRRILSRGVSVGRAGFAGMVAGGLGVALAVLLTSAMLLTCGLRYLWAVVALAAFHIPVVVVEVAATGFMAALIARARPDMLGVAMG